MLSVRTFRMFAAYVALILLVWLGATYAFSLLPTLNRANLRGAYPDEGTDRPFRWTSDQVKIPLYNHAGPTLIELDMGHSFPESNVQQPVTLANDTLVLATFSVINRIRHYQVLLPPDVQLLQLKTSLYQPPGDSRWLGVQLYDLRATPTGLPLRAATDGLLVTLVILPLLLILQWAWRRSLSTLILILITISGLILRLIWLDQLPPGLDVDEAVSIIDAWHLLHTGRDHLSNLLPLGAFEAFGDWISPLLTYLELPFVALLGPVPLAGRLATALAGTIAIPVGYGLARTLNLPPLAAGLSALIVALSPWQIFLSRVAIPPGLVPLGVTLCLWTGVRFIRSGTRASALWLALTGGLALYAYPTLKLLVPLLGILAVLLALRHHGWGGIKRWWPAALLVGLIWLPFLNTTLFNPYSNMRMNRKGLRADTPTEWLVQVAQNYTSYFNPAFYYTSGDANQDMSEGVQLVIEAPLVLLGLGALAWRCATARRRTATPAAADAPAADQAPAEVWWFIAGVTLVAALPASVTTQNPNVTRGAIIAPIYALLVGMGCLVLIQGTARLRDHGTRRIIQAGLGLAFLSLFFWQSATWMRTYVADYPRRMAQDYQDGLLEAFQRAEALAPQFDEVWIDGGHEAPMYLLATLPLPPAEVQAQMIARHALNRFTLIRQVGRYQFDPPEMKDVPHNLPALTLILDQLSHPRYILQAWQSNDRRILILRSVG
jgi:hypothetical protein